MNTMMRTIVLAAAFGFLLYAVPAHAASDTADANETRDLEELVTTLEDDAEREKLVAQLKALLEARRGTEGPEEEAREPLGVLIADQLTIHGEILAHQLSELAGALLRVPEVLNGARRALADPDRRAIFIEGALALLAVVAAGLIASAAVRRLLRRPLAKAADRPGDSWVLRAPLLLARLIIRLMPPAAFAAAGWAAAILFGHPDVSRPIALLAVEAVAIAGAVSALSHVFLAPKAGTVRVGNVSDETAQYLFIWVRRLAAVGVYGYFGIQVAGYLGLSDPAQLFLLKLLGLAFALLLIMLVLQNRASVASLIGGSGTGPAGVLRRRLGDFWHALAILYVLVVLMVWVVDLPGGFAYVFQATVLSIVSISVAILVLILLGRLLDRSFAVGDDLKLRLPGLEARVNRYLPAIKSVLRFLVWTVAILSVLQAWGMDTLLWLADSAGREVLARVATIGGLLILAVVAWEATSVTIERYLSSDDMSRNQRAKTLLPLIRKVVLAVLIVIVGLTLLSELGINITPLLAGAGVAGLAIGFGAQKLVQDIITGLFILIEDTVSVGDYVALGDHGGTVEALSIRSLRLRDPSGVVHTVPFSEVSAVINYTREFAYAVMDIGVAYKEDVDQVITIIEEVGAALKAEERWSVAMLDNVEVLGLDRFDDSAVVIRARVKTVAGQQWAVRRAFNRLLKKRFDADGIEIPFPQRTVWFAGGNDAEREKGPDRPASAGKTESGKSPGD